MRCMETGDTEHSAQRAEYMREVELLKANDVDAWLRALDKAVRVEMGRFRHSRLVREWHIDEGDLLAMLYEDMIVKGKLGCYRGEGSLHGWLGKYVRGYILRICTRPPSEPPIPEVPDGASVDGVAQLQRREAKAIADRCFGALCRRNPAHAYVYYLKLREGLSSRDVRDYMALSSVDNVDQIFSRFKRSFREMVVRNA